MAMVKLYGYLPSKLALFGTMLSSYSLISLRNKSDALKKAYRHLRQSLKYKKKLKRQREEERLLPRKMQYDLQSLSARGFLRNCASYEPSPDVEKKISTIAEEILGKERCLTEPVLRYKFLFECVEKFKHNIPNSQLHKMKTVDDVIEYYQLPVRKTTPYSSFINMDLPDNLVVQQDYIRFNPETDTLFNGVSAFPGRSTIVTGLKAKKLYKGYKAEPVCPIKEYLAETES